MAKGFKGDLAGLRELAENLRKLGGVPSRASRAASEKIAEVIQDQFDAGVDPYGEPWAPLAPSTLERKQGPGILDETGAMRESIDVSPMSGAGVKVTIGEDYARFHQEGTSRMPARKILPEEELPDTWARAIEDAVDEAFEKTLAGEDD